MELAFELIVWFIITLAIGITIFSFIVGVDYNELYVSVKNVVSGSEDSKRIEGKNLNQTILSSLEHWKSCGYGEVAKNYTIYFNETGVVLNESVYVDKIIEWNLCDIISKSSRNCGLRDEILIANEIVAPRIILISCDPVSKQLVIE